MRKPSYALPESRQPVAQQPPPSDGQFLFDTYGIKVASPLSRKIEILVVCYRLETEAIARLLGIEEDEAKAEKQKLEKEWLRLGQPLSFDERAIARGQMVAELTILKRDIEDQMSADPDSKLLTLRMQILNQLAKLQGLDTDKKMTEPGDSDTPGNKITEALNSMGTEQIERLMLELASSPSPGMPS